MSESRDEAPSDAALEAVHERYLVEVVEALGLCPFARRSRLSGRVHRVLVRLDTAPTRPEAAFDADGMVSPEGVAKLLLGVVEAHPDAEIVLLTFVLPEGDAGEDHPWRAQSAFRRFMHKVGDAHRAETDATQRFFMACFHPTPPEPFKPIPMTSARFVHRIRMTPDPVIQCVRASVLETVRAQYQVQAEVRWKASIAKEPPALREILERSVGGIETLSQSIDQRNFKTVGDGDGRVDFEARVEAILEARRALSGHQEEDHGERGEDEADQPDDGDDEVDVGVGLGG